MSTLRSNAESSLKDSILDLLMWSPVGDVSHFYNPTFCVRVGEVEALRHWRSPGLSDGRNLLGDIRNQGCDGTRSPTRRLNRVDVYHQRLSRTQCQELST